MFYTPQEGVRGSFSYEDRQLNMILLSFPEIFP